MKSEKIEANKPCCICNSNKSDLLFNIHYPELNYPGEFSLRRCNICGLLFNSPRLSNQELFKLYEKDYYFFQRRESDEFQRIVDIYLKTIVLIDSEKVPKKIVEIGSAKGYLLAVLKHLGWDIQGIELSSEASQYARLKLEVPTFTGTIEQYAESAERDVFPVVVAIDVIEHVPDPIAFMNSIDKIIKQDGILIIATPNGDAQNIEYLGSHWKGFNPFHIFLFSIANLKLLLSRMGYSIDLAFSYGNRREETFISRPTTFKSNAKALLRKLGIFEQVKHAYKEIFKMRQLPEKEINSLIEKSVEAIKISSAYLNSEDSRDELSKNCRGDNIIIVARKSHA